MTAKTTVTRLDALRIRHFQLVQKLAELGSVRRAAEALHVSQPAASAMLQEAEARLGIALFHRRRSGVSPTPEAEPVLRRIRFLLGELQGLGEDLLDSPRRRPLVRIGAVPHALLGVVQDFAAHWAVKGGVRLVLLDGPTSSLSASLLHGDVDAIVAPLTPEAGTAFTSTVKSRPLYSESVVVAAAARHVLARSRSVPLAALAAADWVLPGMASRSRQALEGEFLRLGHPPPRPSVEVASFVGGLALVSRTAMLTVAPATAVLVHEKTGSVKRLATPFAFRPYAVHWITRRDGGAGGLLDAMGEWLARRVAP